MILFCDIYILTAGEEAKRVFNDAQNMLRNIQNDGSLQMKGTVGFYRAHSVGDDFEILDEDGVVLETLHGIRQQVPDSFCLKCNLVSIVSKFSCSSPTKIDTNSNDINYIMHANNFFETGRKGWERRPILLFVGLYCAKGTQEN